MNFQRINIITGWMVWLAATLTYFFTVEPTMSFWDCGEFIASAYKLEVGHPPGAPFFMLIARVFAIFGAKEDVAFLVNMVSVLAASFTILFLYWSITHFAKKIADQSGVLNRGKMAAVIGSGLIGALAYAWSDSFWFSATEGEVYAMSSLFTAIVFWAILKWESNMEAAEQRGIISNENRWIIFIAYMMGLSIGVHLLNLLAIPAICFVYYFKKYPVTKLGVVYTFLISLLLLGLIQVGVIQGLVKIAGWFERTFVNGMGLPFNSGTIVYCLLVIGAIVGGLWWSRKKGRFILNTLILGVTMAIIGYSTFAVIVIRSAANPPMDENNPENLFALLAYLNREQYGDRPLLSGPYWNTPMLEEPFKDGPPVWVKSFSVKTTSDKFVLSARDKYEADQYVKEKGSGFKIVAEYIDSGEKRRTKPVYDPDYCTLFPRMHSGTASHVRDYKTWSDYQGYNTPTGRLKLERKEDRLDSIKYNERKYNYIMTRYDLPQPVGQQYQDSLINAQAQIKSLERQLVPNFVEDKTFFLRYQVGWMYLRYFMWNFAGKQNDMQGAGDFREGNWLSGIKKIDEQRLGNRDRLPESVTNNKGFNKYYYLPLILGLIGLIFQLVRHPKDFSVVTLLFLLTGLAIVVYLNQTPQQPRERDYAYSGSFYAFAFWIGLAVYALYYAATNMTWKQLGVLAAMLLGGTAFIYLMETVLSRDSHAFGYSLGFISIITLALFTAATAMNQLRGMDMMKGVVCTVLCLPAPYIMIAEGFNDHTRAKRRTGVDFAKNYLDTLEPNAIIFTNGDNDTFPLWYAQEVEDYRTDVRIVNLSLLNTDWYIDQMKMQAYKSPPVPITMKEAMYRQGTRDIVLLSHDRNTNDAYLDVDVAMNIALDNTKVDEMGDGRKYNYLPTYKFKMDIDPAVAEKFRSLAAEGDSVVTSIQWKIGSGSTTHITKNQLAVLDIIRNNRNFERPVYFAVTTGPEAYMGLEPYFQLEGLAYRLVPILHYQRSNPNVDGGVQTELMYNNLMNDFQWGNMDTEDLYLDENNRRMTTNMRLQFSNLAEALIGENKSDSAINVLDKAFEVMPEKNVPFDRVILPLIEGYFDAGDSLNGRKYAERLFEINRDDMEYYQTLEDKYVSQINSDYTLQVQVNLRIMETLMQYFPKDEKLLLLQAEMDKQLEEVKQSYPDDPDLDKYQRHFDNMKETYKESKVNVVPPAEF